MLSDPGYMTFLESKDSDSAFFKDSEIRAIKKYCQENDGVVRFSFVGDCNTAELQFGPSLYDRLILTRTFTGYVLRLKSEDYEVQSKKIEFQSFKEMMDYVKSET